MIKTGSEAAMIKERCNVRWSAGLFFVSALSMGCSNKNESRGTPEAMQDLQKLEKKYLSIKSPEAPFTDLLKAMEREAKKLVYLTVDNRTHYASVVYFCMTMENEYSCPGYYADDTIHLVEFPEMYSLVPLNQEGGSRLALHIHPDYLDEIPDLFTGDPAEMHASGYRNITKVSPDDSGSFQIKLKNRDAPQVLFAIVKGKSDFLYKKYVWIVK